MKNINIVLQIDDALAARLLNGHAVAGKSQAVAIVKNEIMKILSAFTSEAPLPSKKEETVVDEVPAVTPAKKTRKSAAKKESAE